jgi:Predicted small integral membrane protein (DUF2165)
MLVMRLAKVAMVAALAAFALLVAYNNVFDYDSNYQFVRHVLSMDTVFPDSVLRSRAINNETIWHAAYALIIASFRHNDSRSIDFRQPARWRPRLRALAELSPISHLLSRCCLDPLSRTRS